MQAEARLQQRELAGCRSLLRNMRLRYPATTLILGLVYLSEDAFRPEPRGLDAPKSLLGSSTSSGTRDIPTLGVAATEAGARTPDMLPLQSSPPLPSETQAQTPELSPSIFLSSEPPSLSPPAPPSPRPPPPALMNSTFALKRYPKYVIDVFVAEEYQIRGPVFDGSEPSALVAAEPSFIEVVALKPKAAPDMWHSAEFGYVRKPRDCLGGAFRQDTSWQQHCTN